jgi:hypothetical protein
MIEDQEQPGDYQLFWLAPIVCRKSASTRIAKLSLSARRRGRMLDRDMRVD